MNLSSGNMINHARGAWWRWLLVVPAFFVGSIGGGYMALQPIIFLSNLIAPAPSFLLTIGHLVQAFVMGFGGVWLT